MSAFQAKYTDQQRDAFVSAVIDRGASAAQVARMAKAGQLRAAGGAELDPFDVPPATVRDAVRKARNRRLGRESSQLASLPPRDAIEALRRRMVNLADRELRDLERRAAGTVDAERFRQLGRVLREVQAIPGPKEDRAPAPGQHANGKQHGGQTRGGMAGELIAAHRGSTAQDATHDHERSTENGAAQDAARSDDGAEQGTTDDRPGSLARSASAPALSAA